MWANKLGLEHYNETLINEFFNLMFISKADYTILFRKLSDIPDNLDSLKYSFYLPINDELNNRWEVWLKNWQSILKKGANVKSKSASMKSLNPVYTWREWMVVGASNAVNLTDGLDGLAIVPVMIAAASFGFISYLVGNAVFSDYLQIHFVPGTGELAVFCGALLGAGLGFLWYNAPPAWVFMGDTGSLALGGALGAIALVAKHELVLVIIGGLFVLEAVSVIVQVASFKLTGKRVFRMAPLHHHFEKKGWAEPTIVIRFWIISVVLAMAGLATLKLR